MDIRPIRTDADYDAALARVEALLGVDDGTPEGDELDVLLVLVEAYEDHHYPAPKPGDPIDVLKFMMAENDRSQKDLAELLGSASRASEILNRRRSLSLDQIRLLQTAWGVPATIMVREPAYA